MRRWSAAIKRHAGPPRSSAIWPAERSETPRNRSACRGLKRSGQAEESGCGTTTTPSPSMPPNSLGLHVYTGRALASAVAGDHRVVRASGCCASTAPKRRGDLAERSGRGRVERDRIEIGLRLLQVRLPRGLLMGSARSGHIPSHSERASVARQHSLASALAYSVRRKRRRSRVASPTGAQRVAEAGKAASSVLAKTLSSAGKNGWRTAQ
jgi:hypothetical protein